MKPSTKLVRFLAWSSLVVLVAVAGRAEARLVPEQARLLPTDGAGSTPLYFGTSVAVDGDVVVVGAMLDDDRGDLAGSAWVYRWDGAEWNLEAKLLADDGAWRDYFGIDVAVSGDTVFVSAPYRDGAARDGGAVYVFEHDSGGGWLQTQKLTASDESEGTDYPPLFGYRIAASGGRLAVGAYGADEVSPSSADAGAVYLFERGAAGWTETARLGPPGAHHAQVTFGESVGLDGDRLVVGMTGVGAFNGACLFEWDGTAWQLVLQPLPPGLVTGDGYGEDVQVQGERMLILAPGHAVGDGRVGVAYVWERVSGVWQVAAELARPVEPGAPPGGFTFASALDGNWIALADYRDDGAGDETGVVYLFQRDGTGWSARTKVAAADGGGGDRFGKSVALQGSRLVVGAPESVGWGRVYLYDAAFDTDGDGAPDPLDVCPSVPDPLQPDADGDGVGDACDSCPVAWDDRQDDADGDEVGDACDPCTDKDSDGFGVNLTYGCPGGPAPDCMDWSPNVNPGMPEILLDGIDNDCNPLTPITGPACATVASAEMVLPPASTAPWLAASWLTCRMIARRRRLGESRPPTSPA